MNSISESLRPPETSSGRAAKGNCVVVRRGGEQPAAELRSQTKVNQIRLRKVASLLVSGEARRESGIQCVLLPSSTGWDWTFRGGCGGNVAKGLCVSDESFLGRTALDRSHEVVRAAIVAMKRGNFRGAKGGRKVEVVETREGENTSALVPSGVSPQKVARWQSHAPRQRRPKSEPLL
jgi:hypothetical protein